MTDTGNYSVEERLIMKNVKLSKNETNKMCNSVCLAQDAVVSGPSCTLRTKFRFTEHSLLPLARRRAQRCLEKLSLFIVRVIRTT